MLALKKIIYHLSTGLLNLIKSYFIVRIAGSIHSLYALFL